MPPQSFATPVVVDESQRPSMSLVTTRTVDHRRRFGIPLMRIISRNLEDPCLKCVPWWMTKKICPHCRMELCEICLGHHKVRAKVEVSWSPFWEISSDVMIPGRCPCL